MWIGTYLSFIDISYDVLLEEAYVDWHHGLHTYMGFIIFIVHGNVHVWYTHRWHMLDDTTPLVLLD
jgi:hypothetical protein